MASRSSLSPTATAPRSTGAIRSSCSARTPGGSRCCWRVARFSEKRRPGSRMTFFADDEDRRIARQALNQADELLDDLELLQLSGVADVPSWCGDRATAVRRASIL